MLDKKKVFIGIAPIGWTNDDLPDLGKDVTFEQCISEMALAKYKGSEIGNKYPAKINELKKALKLRKLKIANCWCSIFLVTEPYEKVEKEFRKRCKFLKSLKARVIGVSEQSYSIQGKDLAIFENKYIMNDSEWEKLTMGLNKLGKVAKEYGITLTFHHHMGTVVQTEEEIDCLMNNTEPDSVMLLYDTGHLAYCNEDYLLVLSKYIDRIKHVHLKDIRPNVIEWVKLNHKSFLDGVKEGTFTIPGDGVVDFQSVFKILSDNNYEGWLLVEAEQDPARANSLEYAIKARKFIKKLSGL